MGDARFEPPLVRLRDAADRAASLRRLRYEELVLALAAASRERDPYFANVLASELLNRSRRGAAGAFSVALGIASGVVLLFLGLALGSAHPHNFDDHVFLWVAFGALATGAFVAAVLYSPLLDRLRDRRV